MIFIKDNIVAILMVISVVLISLIFANKENMFYEISGKTMGTSYHIKIPSTYSKDKIYDLGIKIQNKLSDINRIFSTFIKESEISKLNRFNKKQPYKLSEPLYGLFEQSYKISEDTDGYFDITVGPLVNYWGFGKKTKKIIKMPPHADIEKIKNNIGYKKIVLKDGYFYKKNKDMYFDFAAIAKGYGVDEIASVLRQNGINDFLVEIGGEITSFGYKNAKNNQKWRISIEKPGVSKSDVDIDILNVSIATSGDYRNFFELNGEVFSHEISPKTGYPVSHNLASVTVIENKCFLADAYATALMVMGEKQGYDWALKKNIAAVFYIKNKGKDYIIKSTPAFKNIINLE